MAVFYLLQPEGFFDTSMWQNAILTSDLHKIYSHQLGSHLDFHGLTEGGTIFADPPPVGDLQLPPYSWASVPQEWNLNWHLSCFVEISEKSQKSNLQCGIS